MGLRVRNERVRERECVLLKREFARPAWFTEAAVSLASSSICDVQCVGLLQDMDADVLIDTYISSVVELKRGVFTRRAVTSC